MKDVFERAWVSMLNSPAWRRVTRSSIGSKVLESNLFAYLDTKRRLVLMRSREARQPDLFESVEKCLVLIGHVKSGGSLIGALLDAHPAVVMADEIDIGRYVDSGFSRDQIFHLLVKGAHRESLKGRITARRLDPYSLAVPGQWQGTFNELKVIGESRAGPTTRRLGRDPELLDRMRGLMGGVELRFLQVVRSPWDPIGAMVARSGKSLSAAVAEYERRCEILRGLRTRLDPGEFRTVWYEDMVSRPAARLAEVCRFLGLEASDEYLEASSAIVRTDRVPERNLVEWTGEPLRRVQELIRDTEFLSRYEGDQPGEIAWRTS